MFFAIVVVVVFCLFVCFFFFLFFFFFFCAKFLERCGYFELKRNNCDVPVTPMICLC